MRRRERGTTRGGGAAFAAGVGSEPARRNGLTTGAGRPAGAPSRYAGRRASNLSGVQAGAGHTLAWGNRGSSGKRHILVATSGDTGSAVAHAFHHVEGMHVILLYPSGRISTVQELQLTTLRGNVTALEIGGTFDDCQRLVKEAFADTELRSRMHLTSANSINIARLLPQTFYYIDAWAQRPDRARPVEFSVPSGNFGNSFRGGVARRMGVPIAQLICASNRNDILTRFFSSGVLELGEVVPTISPSMDIQVSSNFERLLFEMNDRDGGATAEQLQTFRTSGRLSVEPDQWADFIDGTFLAERVDDEETLEVIGLIHREAGMLLDPHTAVGVGAVAKLREAGALPHTTVTLATAHPAKFPDAVERATGVRPGLPPHLEDLFDRPEHITLLPNDLATVQKFVSMTFS